MVKSTAVISPGLGLYLGQSALDTPPRALIAGENFRIKEGKLSNQNMGWVPFSTESWLPLNGEVLLVDNFFPRGATEHLIFGTLTDLYRYVVGPPDSVVFLTPRLNAAATTASASGTAVTGIGSPTWLADGIKAGDEITFGTYNVTDPDATWFIVQTVDSETTITLTATAGTVSAGPYTIRRLFTGQVFDGWDTDAFIDDGVSGDDLWLATNGKDDVVSWNGTADQVTLNPQLGFKCKIITVFSNMVIYGNILDTADKPTSIINSDPGSPLLAGDVGVGLSSEFKVHDGTDPLENLLTLGDTLVGYSTGHITPFQFVGDPLVFVFRQSMTDIGPVGRNAVVSFGTFHEFIATDSQYRFDGVTLREINPHLWRELIRQMDPLRRGLIFSHFDEENGDLIWSVPLNTDADAGNSSGQAEFSYSEHYLEVVEPGVGVPHSKRAFPFTASGFFEKAAGTTWADLAQTWAITNFAWNDRFFAEAFPENLVGDKDGNIWKLNEAQEADGVSLVSFARFGRVVLETGRERGLLTRVYPFMEQTGGTLTVTARFADHGAGPVTIIAGFPFDLALPEGANFVSVFRSGRFVELEFGTPGNLWITEGYDTDARKGSLR